MKVIGVRFRIAGKLSYYDPGEELYRRGENVIAQTSRGVEYGQVILGNADISDDAFTEPLTGIIRRATPDDDRRQESNHKKEKDAYQICKQKIEAHGLEMNLVDVEYVFDNNKILFYFTADGRIDFRELVKDLASVFHTRIELRQIGVRDETKLLGGIGICGRELCCCTYLSNFAPVSIKMAKEQNLSLNPTKISGVCGRLMCCLKNEEDTYEYLNSRMPSVGDVVELRRDGLTGTVQTVNVLRQTMKILFEMDDNKEIKELPVEDVIVRSSRRKKKEKDKAEETEELSEMFEELADEEPIPEEPVKERSRAPRRGRDRRRKGKEKAESGASRG